MKRFLSRYIALIIPVTVILSSMIFSHSCANTTQAPTGGEKDTIPPVIVKMSPQTAVLGVPLEGARFSFTFDEYVTVKNPKNIILSPPQEKSPKYKLRKKTLDVWFEEPLDSNTTYTLDFIEAVADNNEGNFFPGFTYVFSTGDTIDSMMVTGIVQDCNSLKPMKGITVMLYDDPSDSAVFLKRPVAAVKSDEWGYFCLRNIKDTTYRMYAVKDDNGNNIYNPDENELVAFVDSLIRPVMVVNDSLPELQKYDMKDTVSCQARKTEYELNLFRAKPSRQYIVNKVRVTERSSYITFMAPNAHIDSMWIRGVPADRLVTQFNIQRDSLEIWVNDRAAQPDTLHLFVNYRKTDSLGHLQPELEHVKLYYDEKSKVKGTTSKSSRREIKHEDTVCVFKLEAVPENVEQEGCHLEFTYPVIYESFDSLVLRTVNPRQQESFSQVEVIPDSMNIRKFTIRPKVSLMVGYDYYLKVPHRAFRDINGFYSDSLEVKFAIPNDEKLSTLNLNLTGVNNKYIVDFLTERKDKVLRTYVTDKDGTLVFPYLKAGKYCIRVTEDVNRNSIVDSGSLLDHRQPEKVIFLKFNDQQYIEIPEMAEIDQDVAINEIF